MNTLLNFLDVLAVLTVLYQGVRIYAVLRMDERERELVSMAEALGLDPISQIVRRCIGIALICAAWVFARLHNS